MDDVERVARALCALKVSQTGEDWLRYRQPDSWMLFTQGATAAMREVRLIDAEALRAMVKDDDYGAFDDPCYYRAQGMDIAADWLEDRAGGEA